MRILYSGFFGAAVMKPISAAGFWAGFFAVLLLIPCILLAKRIIDYIRLKKFGVRTEAEIWHTVKTGFRFRRYHHKYYRFSVGDKSYGDVFLTGYDLKKYRTGKKLAVYYDRNDPNRHILVSLSLLEPVGLLILTGIPFLCALYGFLAALCRCF